MSMCSWMEVNHFEDIDNSDDRRLAWIWLEHTIFSCCNMWWISIELDAYSVTPLIKRRDWICNLDYNKRQSRQQWATDSSLIKIAVSKGPKYELIMWITYVVQLRRLKKIPVRQNVPQNSVHLPFWMVMLFALILVWSDCIQLLAFFVLLIYHFAY